MDRKIASPAHRLVAYLIDQVICISLFFFLASGVAGETDFYRILDVSLTNLTIYIYFLALWPIVNAILISKFGGTIGKLLTGTAIESGGINLSFGMAIFRNYIGYIVSGTVAFLGFIWILANKKRQGWHDMMVDSVVTVRNKSMIYIGAGILFAGFYLNYTFISQIVSKIVDLKLF